MKEERRFVVLARACFLLSICMVAHGAINDLLLARTKIIEVRSDGGAKYKTIQAAIDSIPQNNTRPIIIQINSGIYREKVEIRSSFITLQGEDAETTIIDWNDKANDTGPDGKPLGTFNTATVAINGNNFIAKDISIKNSSPPPQGGEEGGQAVALRVSGDMAAFYRVNIYGSQDTLYDHEGRHYFSKCYIEGSIDIILGNGCSFYWGCHIHSIASTTGSLTAQKRSDPKEATGFSFVECLVSGSGQVYLGRAWGPYSRVVYAYSSFDNIIMPEGWQDWDDPERQKTVYYGEYKCSGPGANTDGRVKWSKDLSLGEAMPFLHIGFINGRDWLTEY